MKEVFELNRGTGAIAPRSVLRVMPVGYPAGTKVYWHGTLMYEMVKKISDADMRVFFCAMKAFTDNNYANMMKSKEFSDIECERISTGNTTAFNVSVKELSRVAYKERSRPQKVLNALSNIAGLQIHLLDEKLASKGFAVIVTGAVLSKDKQTIEISVNTRFLVDMAKNLVQYNFEKMLSYKGFTQRLYIVIQGYKFPLGKNKYGYHNILDKDLRIAMNIAKNPNAKRKLEDAFKELGINFVLCRSGKWDYPAKNLKIFNDKSV